MSFLGVYSERHRLMIITNICRMFRNTLMKVFRRRFLLCLIFTLIYYNVRVKIPRLMNTADHQLGNLTFTPQSRPTPNAILKSTAILIASVANPHCLQNVVDSVHTHAPYLPVFVVNGSDITGRMRMFRRKKVGDDRVISVNKDGEVEEELGGSGPVEVLRNQGYQYLILARDDVILVSSVTIPTMAKYLLDTAADVAAVTYCDVNMQNCECNQGMIVTDGRRNLSIVPNVSVYVDDDEVATTCHRSDFVQPFYIVRSNSLLRLNWKFRLNDLAHYDFLFTAKTHNLSLVSCTDIKVVHETTCGGRRDTEDASVARSLGNRRKSSLESLLRKWNLESIYDETDKTLYPNWRMDEGREKADLTILETRFLINIMVDVLNAYQPGWKWIRPLLTERTYVSREELGPCSQRVSGVLEYEYDRYKTYSNKQASTRFSQIMFNETCHYAETFWTLRHHGVVNVAAHVYYVTAVSNDTEYVERLVRNLDTDFQRSRVTLIIVVMDNESAPHIRKVTAMVTLSTVILDVGAPFSRSIGLRTGFDHAIQLARQNNQHDAIGFSVDTSVMMPPDFSDRIRYSTQCGLSAFAPIIYKCMSCNDGNRYNRSDGFWVNAGFGMIGMCLQDYINVGGWDTVWGYRWGAEDVDLFDRVGKNLTLIQRTKEPNYIYVRDPALKLRNPGYYENKNIYPRALPPISLSRVVSDRAMNTRLLEFTRTHVPDLAQAGLEVRLVTASYTRDAKGIYYYVTLSNHSQRNDNRWVLIYSHLSPTLPFTQDI